MTKASYWLASGLVIFSVACGNSGGQRAPSGTVCANNYDPIPVELSPGNDNKGPQKLSLNPGPGGIGQIAGNYTYNGAEVLYKNRATRVQIHTADVQSARTKEWSSSIVCVSGLKPGLIIPPEALLGVSSIGVDSAGKITLTEVREYSIGFANSKVVKASKVGDAGRFDAPSKVYEGLAGKFYLYKMGANNDTDFQIRSEYADGDEVFTLVVKFKRVNPTP